MRGGLPPKHQPAPAKAIGTYWVSALLFVKCHYHAAYDNSRAGLMKYPG
jgi:hypothetical protein